MFEFLKNGFLFITSRFLSILLVTVLLLAAGASWRYIAEHEEEIRQMQQALQELGETVLQKSNAAEQLHHQVLSKQRSIRLKELELAEISVSDYVQAPLQSAERGAELKTLIRLEQLQLDFLMDARRKLLLEKDDLQRQYTQHKEILETTVSSGKYQLLKEWRNKGIPLLFWVSFLFLVIPFLFPLIQYFLLFPLIDKISRKKPAKPLITNRSGSAAEHVGTHIGTADRRTLSIPIAAGEKLFVRTKEGDWGKVRQNLKASSCILWNWKAPLVSIASHLLVPNCYMRNNSQEPSSLTLTSPNEDEYLMHLEISSGRAMILRPRYLVAVSSGIKVRSSWNFSIHHFISGRVRQIVYYGSGSLVIRGGNGLNLYDLQTDSGTFKVEDGILIGYHADSDYRMCRTESFIPYLLRRTSLCDYQLQRGLFITQNQIPKQDSAESRNILERSMDVLLNGIGKLLGF